MFLILFVFRRKYFKFDITLTLTDLLRLDQFELHPSASPSDGPAVGGVLQQSDQELPELERSSPGCDGKMVRMMVRVVRVVRVVGVRSRPATQAKH